MKLEGSFCKNTSEAPKRSSHCTQRLYRKIFVFKSLRNTLNDRYKTSATDCFHEMTFQGFAEDNYRT